MSGEKKIRRRIRWPRGGTLLWIAALLIGSATLRIAFETAPALAREAANGDHRADVPETVADAHAQPESAPPDLGELEQLVRALESREAAVKRRETEIEDRMKALAVADEAIQKRLAELQAAEAELGETLALADGASETDLARLTAVYEQMKPKDAAALFETMDPTFAAGFLGRMRPEAAAGIMAKLTPGSAYSVSAILAGRNALVPRE